MDQMNSQKRVGIGGCATVDALILQFGNSTTFSM